MPPTIFLAEDEQQLRDLLATTIKDLGFQVLVANNAHEALHQIEARHCEIDLLISDVQMPGMSGIDLATELRRRFPDVRVLLISGYPQKPLMLGENWHFLRKPFSPFEITAAIKGILGRTPNENPEY